MQCICRGARKVRVRVWVRVRVEDISAKTQASSVNPLNNSCYLVGILCLKVRVRVRVRGDKFPQDS
jgi:hypothetical protein